MNEKHRQVESWLECVFGGENVPQYEINHHTVDILHDLMLKNEHGDRCAGLIIEDMKQKAEEYSVESYRLSQILKRVGLSPGLLSQSGTVSLRTLTNTAVIMEVMDTSNTSLLLAMTEQSQAAARLQEARRTEQRLSSQLLAKTKAALVKHQALKKALQSVEDQWSHQGPELEKKAKQAGFLQSKTREYKRLVQQLQADMKAVGADPSIYHCAILQRAEELKELKDKLHPMKARLDSYQKLPPDLSLAKVKVEEAKRELKALEEEVTQHIDLMRM